MKYYLLIFVLISEICFSLSKYNLKCNQQLLDLSHDTMMSQVDIIERSNKNDGEVQKYLKSVGLVGNYPYCAAGQYWCFEVSANALKLPRNSIPILRNGLANAIYNHAKKVGRQVEFSPQKNDLIVWRKQNSSKGHIERVITVQKKGWITTVGFNTSSVINKKYTEGVFIKKRNIYHIIGLLKTRGLIGFEK